MVIDCHVHVSANTPGHGSMSRRLLQTLSFRLMRWRFGMSGTEEDAERTLEKKLNDLLEDATQLDAAVILAFDAVYDRDGNFDAPNTHLYVTNDYVMQLARRHRKMLFGASVHPYRKDAAAEVERVAEAGAVLIKWLPIVQNINPADDRCIPMYEAMAHYKLPLLCHTGPEHTLVRLDDSLADPRLLVPALKRGVTVIGAHCGTHIVPGDRDYLKEWLELAKEYEHFYGDTAALNLPVHWKAYDTLLTDETARRKLIHGSDWPVSCVPPPLRVGLGKWAALMREGNGIRRDVLAKRALGFDEEYFQRASKVLRLAGRS